MSENTFLYFVIFPAMITHLISRSELTIGYLKRLNYKNKALLTNHGFMIIPETEYSCVLDFFSIREGATSVGSIYTSEFNMQPG